MLVEAPPYEVEQAIRRLGRNLRTARLRRNLTKEEVAEKIGTSSRAVMDAERGKHSNGIAVYAALPWALDLLEPFQELAVPVTDQRGALRLTELPAANAPAVAKGWTVTAEHRSTASIVHIMLAGKSLVMVGGFVPEHSHEGMPVGIGRLP